MGSLSELFRKGGQVASANSTALLTGVGVAGTVSTAILSGKASIKAYEILNHEASFVAARDNADYGQIREDMRAQEKIGLVWQEFIPPVGVGMLTIVAIIMSQRLSSREATALAAAYGLSERAFDEYKAKVVEKFGNHKETAVRDEVAQDKVDRYPIEDNTIIIAGDGDVLCMDALTGRYFKSTMETIRSAQNKVNNELVNHGMSCSLSRFYDEIGLPPTDMSDYMGWNNLGQLLEIDFSAAMSSDKRPCMVITFNIEPTHGYDKIY